jgi:hypothetical protein
LKRKPSISTEQSRKLRFRPHTHGRRAEQSEGRLDTIRDHGSIVFYASAGARTPAVPAVELMRRSIPVYGFLLPTSSLEGRR